jgi:mannose-6-phosphate isomerase-like protein (cupin superfamily)
MHEPVNVKAKLASFTEHWVPKVIAELNGQQVKVAKLQGEYVWHSHANEDELFLVVEGELELHLRDGIVTLRPGELYVVPKGVEHKPVSKPGADILVFEPATTRNTGDVDHEYTIEAENLDRI